MKKAANLKEMLRSTDLGPLKGENFKKFFVETDEARGVNAALRLSDYFEINVGEPKKVLFMGHRGSGKSTELYRFSEYLKEEFRIIHFSVKEVADTADLNYTDLIFIVLQALYDQAEKDGLSVNEHVLANLDHYWRDEKLIERLKIETADVEASAKAKGGFWSLISLHIRGAFRIGSETKTVVREHIRPRLSQLLVGVNDLIADITRKYAVQGKTPLIIIEDLDKVDLPVAEELFLDRKNVLTSFDIHMIYTFPIFLHYSSKFNEIERAFDSHELLSVIKVKDKTGQPFEPGRKAIREILEKRFDLSLIAEDAREDLIEKCGGSLRHLFQILQNAVLDQRVRDREARQIDKAAVESAFRKLRNYFERTLTSEHMEILKAVHESPDKKPAANDDLKEMLNCMAVIEYNGDRWCDLHPAVAEILADKGKI